MIIAHPKTLSGPLAGFVAFGITIIVLSLFFHPRGPISDFTSSILPSYNSSLIRTATAPRREASWLLATMIAASSQQRRHIIRQTWQRFFASPRFDFRFVIANYDPVWAPFIAAENDTHGDLICLSHIAENRDVANHIKTMEFWRHLTGPNSSLPQPHYDWVSKVDDDTFLDPTAFYKEWLENTTSTNRTLVGMTYEPWQTKRNYTYLSGRFYTMSWDVVEVLSSLYAANPITNEHEDALTSRLLYEAKERHHILGYPYEKSPNIGDKGLIDKETYIMHNLKHDEDYLRVASVFNETGYTGIDYPGITSYDANFPQTKQAEAGRAAGERKKKEKEERKKKEKEEEARKKVEKEEETRKKVEEEAMRQAEEEREKEELVRKVEELEDRERARVEKARKGKERMKGDQTEIRKGKKAVGRGSG